MKSEESYRQSFGLEQGPNEKKAKIALDYALDIRKFEIGLYWHRAAYFWALIAGAFAAYFAILSAERLNDKEYLAYIVGCIGSLFTWAWYWVNRGSKFWQENWENHVDMIEDSVCGPLYKTILHRPKPEGIVERIIGPAAISVSKVNQWVSLFTLCIWGALVIHSLPEFGLTYRISVRHIAVGLVTLLFGFLIAVHAKTDFRPYDRRVTRREATSHLTVNLDRGSDR